MSSSAKNLFSVSPLDPTGRERRWALIVVDVQNDFITGSMALKSMGGEDGAEVVPVINRLLDSVRFDLVIYSRDYHSPDHCSFDIETAIPARNPPVAKWPPHCVAGTWGAEFAPNLQTNPPGAKVVHILKGTKPDVECFSAFGGIILDQPPPPPPPPTLNQIIQGENINAIFVCGLATDYCVWETCRDSKKLCPSQETYLLVDASRGTVPFDSAKYAEFKLTTTDRLIGACLCVAKKLPRSQPKQSNKNSKSNSQKHKSSLRSVIKSNSGRTSR